MNKFECFDKNAANFVPLTPLSFLKRTALIFPDKPATVYGDRQYSWGQVYERCCRLASGLNARGIGKGDTVSIIASNQPEMVEAHFGIPMSGAVLNTINTRLEAETIAYILEHGEARVVIIDAELSPEGVKAIAQLDNPDLLVIDILDAQANENPKAIGEMDYEAFLATGDPTADWHMPSDEWDAIALNYTSGTTNKPKGVVYHHRGAYLMAIGTVSDWSLPAHPKYLAIVPMFHCNGWCHSWAMAAVAGTIICTRVVTAKIIYDAIDRYKVSHFGGAPIVLGMILNAADEDRKAFDHPIEVFTAGAPPPAAILEGIEKIGFNVTQVYGLTETYGHTLMCAWNSKWDGLDTAARSEIKARTGAIMVMMEDMRVVDTQTMQDVPADGETIGEILMRGNATMKGYLKNAEATDEAFEGGWFHTGDLAVMHENGYAQVKDRLKDIIISGGENISSVEVEAALHRHPAVALAAVVAKPDEKWGEVPCAFVELKQGASVTAQEIIDFCRSHLAGFKRPKQVVFCELPKTATGKIQKFELRKML
ncbi:MAG: acyl-CoA synthetase [Rhodobacterales bacterium]